MVLTKKFSEFAAITKSGVNQLVGLSDGANAISDLPINWTTALRPVAPTNGFSGYNTDLSQWEYWNATTTSWVQLSGGGSGTVTLVNAGTGLTGGAITTAGTIALDIPVTVPHGGIGVTSVAAYALVCGGTTSSSPLQVVSGLGSAGQVLMSSGAGALPTWQTVGGSGTVSSGLINQVAWYAASGTVVSGLATTANGVLVTSAGGVPSIATSLPATVQSNITALGTIASGVWQGTGITVPFGGTGNSTFTAYSVICAGTTATGAFQNVSGLGTAGQVLTSNGAGGLPSWSSSSGTGTVNAGLINELAYYAAAGTVVSGLTTGNNGVLVTSAGGVPSISSTLPAAVQANITAVGTVITGVWQGTPVALAFGGTNANLTASLGGIFYSTATAGAILAGTATARQMLQSGSSAAPAWSTATWPATTSINRILYSSAANTVSEIVSAANATLITDGTGIPSISSTLPSTVQTNITQLGTIVTGIWNSTAVTVPFGGTGASTFVAYSVICGGTTTTGALQSVASVGTSGQVLTSSGPGLLPTWQTAVGTGTVSAGLINQVAWYAANGTTVSGLTTANGGVLVTSNAGVPSILVGSGTTGTVLQATSGGTPAWSTAVYPASTTINELLFSSAANVISGVTTAANGILITSAGGVPSISSTLPATVQGNITTVGTVTSGTWNATPVTVPFGGTGNTTFTAYSVICAGTTATGTFQNVSGVGSIGQVLVSNGAGTLPTWQNVSGTGTVNSGLINQVAYYAAAGTAVSGLTTANGGVLVTSNTGVPSILAGSGTTGTILRAISGAAPAWSTATYPATTTINQLLYSSSANVIAGVATANGGVVATSNTGVPTVVAGSGTTGTMLQATSGGTPAWSTTSYPATNAVNTLLYASSANVMAALATANSGVLVTSGAGVPSILAAGLTGQYLQASTAGTPAWSTATLPTTGGSANTILISDGTNFINSTATYLATTTVNQILYSSATNVISGLATANSGVLATTSAGVPVVVASSGSSGKVLQSVSGGTVAFSTPTYPSASGTSRTILVSDGTNNVYSTETWAVPGTSGNVLTSDGTNWTSAAPSGGGAWVKITRTVASSSASVVFSSLTTTYQAYAVVMTSVIPATDAVSLFLTYNAIATNYESAVACILTGGTQPSSGALAAVNIRLNQGSTNTISNTANAGYAGVLFMFGPNTAKMQYVSWTGAYLNSSGTPVFGQVSGAGRNTGTTAVTSITFAMSSGNIASGVFELYGLTA